MFSASVHILMEDYFYQNTIKSLICFNPLINPLIRSFDKLKVLSDNLSHCFLKSTIMEDSFNQIVIKSLIRF